MVTFVDSNNAVYPLSRNAAPRTRSSPPSSSPPAVNLAVDNEATPAIYPVSTIQFIAGTTTYTVNVPVAYQNARRTVSGR